MGKKKGPVVSIAPASVNPTLKTKVTITLDPNFPGTLNRKDFSVSATNTKDAKNVRLLNVIEVDQTKKTLLCMFGGAWSGQYKISIRQNNYGLLDTDTNKVELTVESTVSSVSPQTGSIYGGTLLTIKGTNFGKEFTDNPVQISTLGAVGSVDCFLQKISTTEIQCRLDTTTQEDKKKGEVVVFLKTSEEAKCDPKTKCAWTYTSTIPEVTEIAAKWDDTDLEWTVEVIGKGFSGTKDTTELFVDGSKMTTKS
jgi:hypothetical protein